jgi:hypothetical protein
MAGGFGRLPLHMSAKHIDFIIGTEHSAAHDCWTDAGRQQMEISMKTIIATLALAFLAATAAQAQTKTDRSVPDAGMSARYCIHAKGKTTRCNFASLAACKKVAKSGKCITNPHLGTTGSGAAMKSDMKSGSMKKSKTAPNK